ncbi:MAG: helix-turn-helix transcriptional regulator [Candidatus Omnitrophica bacterium]|nr:helix-turn-helix transcriptional regulator [Candidatus Omnitrophota bacterium]
MARKPVHPNLYGARLRALRHHRKLSLVQLAQRSSVDKSTISYLERGLRTGTVELVSKLCRGLGVTLADFYAGLEGWQGPVELQRAQARVASYVVAERGMSLQHLTTSVLGKPFLPALLDLAPGGSTLQEALRPGTMKFCYLFEGQLVVDLNDQKHGIGTGDSIFFDAALPHTITNPGSTTARAIVIVSPPAL